MVRCTIYIITLGITWYLCTRYDIYMNTGTPMAVSYVRTAIRTVVTFVEYTVVNNNKSQIQLAGAEPWAVLRSSRRHMCLSPPWYILLQ